MADAKFRIILEGDDRDALRDIDNVVKGLNKIKDARNRMSTERQKIAREERKDRFNALKDDEKRERLLSRQITLERQLQRARQQGNLNRVSALELRGAQNRQQLRGLGSGGGSGVGDAAAGIGAGALLGKVAGVLGIAVTAASVVRALSNAVVNSVRFADELGDAADIIGITKEQALQITKSAGFAGVNPQKVFSGLSALSAARSAALSGDETAKGLFKRYNVDESETDIFKLGKAIIQAMGPGGMQARDRGPIGQLFGLRPEGTIKVLSGLEEVEDRTKKSIDVLERTHSSYERVKSTWQLMWVDLTAMVIGSISKAAMDLQSFWDRSWFSKYAKPGFGSRGAGTAPDSWANKRRADDTLPARNVNESIGMKSGEVNIPQADALARFGLYRGGIDSNRTDILRSQLEYLRGIKAAQIETLVAIKGNW